MKDDEAVSPNHWKVNRSCVSPECFTILHGIGFTIARMATAGIARSPRHAAIVRMQFPMIELVAQDDVWNAVRKCGACERTHTGEMNAIAALRPNDVKAFRSENFGIAGRTEFFGHR